MDEHELHRRVLTYERGWIAFALGMLVLFLALIGYTLGGQLAGVVPHGEAERVDPARVRVEGPWADPARLVVETAPGRYTVHALAFAFGFQPNPIEVPQGAEVTFKITSPDVIHGFHVEGTPINVEVIPGRVAVVRFTFRRAGEYRVVCNQYCGLGHHTMFGRLIVVPSQGEAVEGDGR